MRQPLLLAILFLFAGITLTAQESTSLILQESEELQSAFDITYPVSTYHNKRGETTVVRTRHWELGKPQMLVFSMFTQPHQDKGRYWIELKKKDEFIGAIQDQDTIHALVAGPRKKGSRTLYRYSVSLDAPNHIQKSVISFETKAADAHIEFKPSEDGSHFALVTTNARGKRNVYTLNVIRTDNFQLVYSHEFLSNYERKTVINDVILGEDLKTYLAVKEYYTGTLERYNNNPNYQYKCYAIDPEHVQEILVSKHELYIPSVRLDLHEEKLQLVGYYSETFKKNTLGVCMIPIDLQKNENLDPRFIAFPPRVNEDLGLSPKKHPDLSYVDHLLRDEQDNLYVIGESTFGEIRYYHHWYFSNPFFNPLMMNPAMNFHMGGGPSVPEPPMTWAEDQTLYNEIVIQKISPKGDLLWGRAIDRKSDESFGVFMRDDQLHFLLNAGESNGPSSSGKIKFRYTTRKASSLFHLTCSATGDFRYAKARENADEYNYMPWLLEAHEDRYIMPGTKKTEMRLMYVEPSAKPLARDADPSNSSGTAQ